MLGSKLPLEDKFLTALDAIGYRGPLLNKQKLLETVDGGPKNKLYTEVVNYLTNEIRTLSNIDEEVNVIAAPEDSVAFVMELTSFLKELNCPYKALTEGHVSDRLQNASDCILVLDYLITELMGARINQEIKPDRKIELKLQETPEAADMRLILQTLRFPKPPANISTATLFQKLEPTIRIVLQKAGLNIVGNPIFNKTLSNQQWEMLKITQKDLNNEYKIRREMLLTRLDVTIQSFQWSDKTKGKDEMIEKIYTSRRKLLKVDPDVDLTDLIAAREDLAIIEKTSNSSVRKNTRTSLNKVIIGQVPDRGGRAYEQPPPPPEMPSWQQRQSGPSGGRGGGNFNRGGGGGSFNRGGGGGGGSRGRGGYSGGNQQSNSAMGKSNYSRGGYSGGGQQSYQQSSFDSAGGYSIETKRTNYGGNQGYDNNSSSYQGGNNYSQSSGYDNQRGGYNNKRGGYDNQRGGYDNQRGVYDNQRGVYDNQRGGYDNQRGGYDNRRESGGGYNDMQDSKRAKTYDSYQSNNRSTYADEYVQDSQRNQQYHSRGGGSRGGGGRGRSNYNRGGRGDYR